MDKVFRMLIGDDKFVDRRDADTSLAGFLMGMSDATRLDFDLGQWSSDGVYRCAKFPLPQTHLAEITVATSVEEMKRHATGNYHVVATDLDYGKEHPYGGFEVLEAFRENRALKALFTSNTYVPDIQQLKACGADHLIAPHLIAPDNPTRVKKVKHLLLGHVIGDHYKELPRLS